MFINTVFGGSWFNHVLGYTPHMDDDNVLFVRYEDFYKVGVTYRSNSVCNQSIRNVEILVLMTTRSSNRIYIIGWMIL